MALAYSPNFPNVKQAVTSQSKLTTFHKSECADGH